MKKVRKLQYMLFIRENILYEMTLNIHFGCISIMPVTVFMGISIVFCHLTSSVLILTLAILLQSVSYFRNLQAGFTKC